MNMQKIKWVLVLASLALLTGSQFAYAEDTFKMSKDSNPSVKAVVKDKTLEVKKMDLGEPEDYSPAKSFKLDVGGCTLEIAGSGLISKNILYDVTEAGESKAATKIYNSESFKVTEDGVAISGKAVDQSDATTQEFSFCAKSADVPKVKFEPAKDDESKSLIAVKLEGESIPPKLVLTLTATLFNETEALASNKTGGEGSGAGLTIGLVVGGIVVVLVLVGGGIGLYFFLKNKKQQTVDREKSQEPPQGDEAPSKTKGDEAPSKTKTKGDGEADTSHKGSAKGKKRAEESVQAAPPKVPKP